MIQYKIYEIEKTLHSSPIKMRLIQRDNWIFDETFDSIEEAYVTIKSHGDDYTHYTILPYIFMS